MWRYFRDQHGKGPGCWNWVPCMQQWLCLNLMHPTGLAGFHTTGGSTGEFLLKPPRDFSVFQKCTQNKSQTTPKLKKRHYFLSHFMMFFIPQNGPKPLMWPEFILTLELVILNFWSVWIEEPQNPQKSQGAKRLDRPPFFHLKAKLFVTMGLGLGLAFPRAFVRCWESRPCWASARDRCLRRWS